MAILRNREIKKMTEKERNKKIKELKVELMKNKVNPSKTGQKIKEIKKTIAKLMTFNRLNKKSIEN